MSSAAAERYFGRVELPEDAALPQLRRLFDAEWVCAAFLERLPAHYGEPQRIGIRHFIHSIGRSAMVSYEVAWAQQRYLPPEYFVAKVNGGGGIALARYPADSRLPGLAAAARPGTALELAKEHILATPPRRARVQLIRYRPEFRAVLRHILGRVRLYARVMRPADVAPFLAAHALAAQSSFVVPGLAGSWDEGGIVWLTEVRGRDLRGRIRKGRFPDPLRLLAGLETLWAVPPQGRRLRAFSLERAYLRALRSFRHNLRDYADSLRSLNALASSLDGFTRGWRPTGMAHNDFYDDQLLAMGDGRLALVDLEDIAPGDPLLDVGNFLAHLRWSGQSRSERRAANATTFHAALRGAALERFGWEARALAMREAVCLFRICTNTIRHPRADWKSRLDAGLALVGECLN